MQPKMLLLLLDLLMLLPYTRRLGADGFGGWAGSDLVTGARDSRPVFWGRCETPMNAEGSQSTAGSFPPNERMDVTATKSSEQQYASIEIPKER